MEKDGNRLQTVSANRERGYFMPSVSGYGTFLLLSITRTDVFHRHTHIDTYALRIQYLSKQCNHRTSNISEEIETEKGLIKTTNFAYNPILCERMNSCTHQTRPQTNHKPLIYSSKSFSRLTRSID